MAYSEALANRIRESLSDIRRVEEKQMMGGLTFMVNGKMCVGIFREKLMCRIDPDLIETVLERTGSEQMEFGGRVMKGYLTVDDTGIKSKKDFDFWIGLSLDFNKFAKASKSKTANRTPVRKKAAKKKK